jgi:hypothetical protein
MTAQYRLGLQTFIAPFMLAPGTVIETDAEPGLHWEPLNAEAKSAKEALFDKEVDVVDPGTGKVVKKKINETKRHLYEGGTPEGVDRAEIRIVSEPPPEQATGLSLAEAQNVRGTPDLVPDGRGQLRPATANPTPTSGPVTNAPSDKPTPGAESTDGSTKIVAPAPPPPAAPKS